ncbi:leucyl aminopeptidase [Sphingomonas hankyongi]|uniref:Probable cytosol aminopeptidase n=1 Tax=Sphingomonas hankyongi TaxID=2908209 RepID=A0ABT0S414_9SPHN|nr:leucyl aminopeptidase [Sphingomonas hankyongi]MCL6730576.1 leucyl aminopeptidase [Sphingomonas hankyongi]
MKIRFADRLPDGNFALVVPATGPDAESVRNLGGELRDALSRQRFEGDAASAAEHFQGGRRIVVLGLEKNGNSPASAEKLGGNAVARLLTSGETAAVIDLTGLNYDADGAARVALGAALRAWRYDRYRTTLKEKQKPTLAEVTIVGAGEGAEDRYRSRWEPVLDGVALTRELVTEPANIIYPESFVERVQASLDGTGVEIEVLDRAQMEKLGMGALLGVAQGSARDPRLLILRWNGSGSDGAPTAFVGKGVTFDTGGISIKPAAGMEAMKWDMGGAGAVAGALKTLARRKAKANIVGICGLVENMPSGTAQRPGDVVTTMSGQSVEVINTDAEGRLVLADAITYVERTYKPSTIVDLATLTGAILISLGHEYAGLFSNNEDLAAKLTKAGDTSGDKLWRMPMGDVFDRLIDSPIADMKNVGPREGGSITAAQFIQRFIDNGVQWAHIDMAGKAWSDKASHDREKGATGFGVRLLDQYVEDVIEA